MNAKKLCPVTHEIIFPIPRPDIAMERVEFVKSVPPIELFFSNSNRALEKIGVPLRAANCYFEEKPSL
jgi:hypothetical protein